MSQDCLIGVFASDEDWETAQREMELRGLSSQHFQLLASEQDVHTLVPHISLQSDQAKPRLLWGAALGGLFGALGSFFVAFAVGGEWAASSAPLGIAATGAIVGALIGALSGWGLPRDRETELLALLHGRKGVVVQGNPEQLAQAEHALRAADAVAIRYYAAPSDPAEEISVGINMANTNHSQHAA